MVRRLRCAWLAGMLLACSLVLPAQAQFQAIPLDSLIVEDVKPRRARVFQWLYQDIGALARRAATPRVAAYAAGAMVFTFSAAWLDDDGVKLARDVNTGTFEQFLDVVNFAGGPGVNIPVVTAAGVSLLTRNERLQDAAWTSLQTLIYAGVLGYTLKGVIGRGRPEWTDNTYAFFSRPSLLPFLPDGNSSFPGGHAIASYGIITPWVMYYPSAFTYALYVIPTGTSIARLSKRKHWPTDVVVGAAIGITMGRWLTRRHQAGGYVPSSGLELSVGEGGALFSVRYRIP